MGSELGKKIRKIALWIMIFGLGTADVLLFIKGQFIWGIFWAIILSLVAIFEIYAYFFSKEKTTISNVWKAWAQKSPFWAYTTLFLIWLGLTSLIVHLAIY